jgi:hypothetical protein
LSEPHASSTGAAGHARRGPLHPVTRLDRVLQQIRSFTTLHASELEGLAAELEAAGQTELAARLRIFRDLHVQEAGLIQDEIADISGELDRAKGDLTLPAPLSGAEREPGGEVSDPAANSPKRARWLAEQARAAEEARRPRSRRDLFTRGAGG